MWRSDARFPCIQANSDWISCSLSSMFTRKRVQNDAVKCILSSALSHPTGSRWSGSNLCGILCPRPICPRERALLCTLETSKVNCWIVFYWTKRIGCKTSFLRYHGDSGKSLEDLGFWKSMNEFSISICVDFTFLCVCWIASVVSDSL